MKPKDSRGSKTVTGKIDASAVFDYVVIGGGPAGCVLTKRIADAKPDASVILIEAGTIVRPTATTVWDPRKWIFGRVGRVFGSVWRMLANLARTRGLAHESIESGPPAETLNLLAAIQKFLWPKRRRWSLHTM